MKKLAEKEYWDSIYSEKFDARHGGGISWRRWLKYITRDFSNFMIWERILPHLLPRFTDYKIMEVGCAPGKYLISFKERFGYEPFGVEYSEKGYEITKKNFEINRISPENIVLADFFSDSFQNNHRGQFDVVFSRGFIEHFDDVERVVLLHAELLKPEGYLVVMIPNLSGVNNILARSFNKASYDLHNINIMNKENFSDIFTHNNLEVIYCDYIGLFSFGLFNTDANWKYYIYRLMLLLQRPIDFFLRVIFGSFNPRNRYTSPYLLFVGKKKV